MSMAATAYVRIPTKMQRRALTCSGLIRIRAVVKRIGFLLANVIGGALIPQVRELEVGDTRIVPYDKGYLPLLTRMWNSSGEGVFQRTHLFLLNRFGKKLCFLMIGANGQLMGFLFFYFQLGELTKRRIHTAFGCIDAKFRGLGYGTILFNWAYNSFRRVKWIRGICGRYSLSNTATRRLHEATGFRPITTYFDQALQQQRVYAVYDLRIAQRTIPRT